VVISVQAGPLGDPSLDAVICRQATLSCPAWLASPFDLLKASGSLPVAVNLDGEAWIAERRVDRLGDEVASNDCFAGSGTTLCLAA